MQKSNHHHWDQSSNYCHPPHASHGKTWSSPSHPHNQQDHCKCKLSLVTALLLARHQSWSPFFSTFVKSISRRFTPTSGTTFLSCTAYSCEFVSLLLLWMWIKCHGNVFMGGFDLVCSYCTNLLLSVVLCLLSALVSGGFSPSSTATSGFSSQGSNTLPCPIPPIAPTSPRGSTGKRRTRKKDHKSSRMTNCHLSLPTILQRNIFAHLNLIEPTTGVYLLRCL